MTYLQKFVAVVKCEGKILRELGDIVTLPFGSEYSILLKNLNSQRCVVSIDIDGSDVCDGHQIIINGNSNFELKGFLVDNEVKNRFKFINKTKQIQDYRGDKIDDGMIRIEFAFEKQTYYQPPIYRKRTSFDIWHNSGDVLYGSSCNDLIGSNSDSIKATNNIGDVCCYNSSIVDDTPAEDEGITVAGSEVSQSFSTTYVGDLEPSHTVILRLKGKNPNGVLVKKTLTTKSKLECKTCGTKSTSRYKFCPKCGTALNI